MPSFRFRPFGFDRDLLNNLIEDEFCAALELCRTNPEMFEQYFEMGARAIASGLDRSGDHDRARNDDGCLLIPIEPGADAIALHTVALTSLSHDCILGARRAPDSRPSTVEGRREELAS